MVQRTTLANGLSVLTECLTESHSVSLGVWVKTGSRHETAPVSGISHFIEHMLFKGTGRRSAHDIAKEIDSVGGILNGFTSQESSCYYVKALAEKLPLAVDLLGDLLGHSRFDPEEIEKERRVIVQEIAMVEDNPEEYVHDMFIHNFWEGHPLGRPVIGTRQTVGGLNREQMLAFLGERYGCDNLVIVAVGQLDHEQLVDLVAATFSDLPSRSVGVSQVSPRVGRSLHFSHRNLEQVHICLGFEGLPHTSEDRYTLNVLNTILGGNMSSRLFQTVREELGAAYSVYSYHNAHVDSGALVLYAATSTDDSRRVTDAMFRELTRLANEPVSEQELNSARDYLNGSLLLSMESSDSRMARLANNELFLGRTIPMAESQARISAVTADDIHRLARSLFRNETLNLQLVGGVDERQFASFDPVFN
ncbi:MAG: peptidase M16 [Desulfuromonas sp.]|nr:MAG: peptidase M16 [Desulfuromonas sp.]